MREEMDKKKPKQFNDFWLPLSKFEELLRTKTILSVVATMHLHFF